FKSAGPHPLPTPKTVIIHNPLATNPFQSTHRQNCNNLHSSPAINANSCIKCGKSPSIIHSPVLPLTCHAVISRPPPAMRTLIFLFTLLCATVVTAAEKRNVVLFVCDDLGFQLGCYGDKVARTPNIDGLAKEGVRFTRAFCTTA